MTVDKKDMLLYAITDRTWLNGDKLCNAVEKALKGGVTFIQLREKTLDYDEFLSEAIEINKLCKKYNVPFIINDNVDIAAKSGADGVHIGQDDITIKEARKILGDNKIIGVSAHNVSEALKAQNDGASYIGSGAVFTTSSKNNVSALSMDTLRKITASVDIPVVAIGGISRDNAIKLKGSGIDGIAVISAIFAQNDIENSAAELRKIADHIVNDR